MISTSSSAASSIPLIPLTRSALIAKASIWFSLTFLLALLHAAEISITTLYPWKVKEFAEEEGVSSPFHLLNKDITRFLTTILVTSTTAAIFR
jgi:hypothetical protein